MIMRNIPCACSKLITNQNVEQANNSRGMYNRFDFNFEDNYIPYFEDGLEKGEHLYNSGRYIDAIKYIKKALQHINDDALKMLLARSLMKIGGVSEVEQIFSSMRTTDPIVAFDQGLIMLEGGVYNEAKKLFEYSLQLDNRKHTLYMLGLTHFRLNEFGDAIRIFEQFEKEDDNYVESLYYKGLALYRFDNFEDACTCLRRVVSYGDTLKPEACCYLGIICKELGEIEGAIQWLNKAKNYIDTTHPFFWDISDNLSSSEEILRSREKIDDQATIYDKIYEVARSLQIEQPSVRWSSRTWGVVSETLQTLGHVHAAEFGFAKQQEKLAKESTACSVM
jgi:tetratricopeptide (TPR) repeat protein